MKLLECILVLSLSLTSFIFTESAFADEDAPVPPEVSSCEMLIMDSEHLSVLRSTLREFLTETQFKLREHAAVDPLLRYFNLDGLSALALGRLTFDFRPMREGLRRRTLVDRRVLESQELDLSPLLAWSLESASASLGTVLDNRPNARLYVEVERVAGHFGLVHLGVDLPQHKDVPEWTWYRWLKTADGRLVQRVHVLTLEPKSETESPAWKTVQ